MLDSYEGSGMNPGCPITLGIRSDEVKVVRAGFEEADASNYLRGRIIAIYNRGSIHTLVVRPHHAERLTVDVEVSSRTLAKLGLVPDAEITLALKPAHLLLFFQEPANVG
jgi:hypothetical protein